MIENKKKNNNNLITGTIFERRTCFYTRANNCNVVY